MVRRAIDQAVGTSPHDLSRRQDEAAAFEGVMPARHLMHFMYPLARLRCEFARPGRAYADPLVASNAPSRSNLQGSHHESCCSGGPPNRRLPRRVVRSKWDQLAMMVDQPPIRTEKQQAVVESSVARSVLIRTFTPMTIPIFNLAAAFLFSS
jgi:hypothetical protein